MKSSTIPSTSTVTWLTHLPPRGTTMSATWTGWKKPTRSWCATSPNTSKRSERLKKKKKDSEGEPGRRWCTEVENPASDAWLLKNMNNPWAGKEGRAARGVDRGARRSTQRRRIRREGIATRARSSPIKAHSTGRRVIIWVGHGLCCLRTPRPQMTIGTYRRSWCTCGVGTQKGFSRFGFSLGTGICFSLQGWIRRWRFRTCSIRASVWMVHGEAVRDIWFCNDGSEFLLAGMIRTSSTGILKRGKLYWHSLPGRYFRG